MFKFSFPWIFLLFFLILLFSCASTQEPAPVPVNPVQEPAPEVVPPIPEVVPPIPEEEPAEKNDTEEFVVSQEIFQETFGDIESLILELNSIIIAKNYEKWLTHLTKEYIATYSSSEKLFEISQQPILKKYNIRLRSLKDYFNYVVVPSRSEARLDDLIFTDNNHIRAIMLINGKRSILYSLEKINNIWKIGI